MLKEYNTRVWNAFIITGDSLLAFDAVQIRRAKTYESARRQKSEDWNLNNIHDEILNSYGRLSQYGSSAGASDFMEDGHCVKYLNNC
jgi:hypothetical protein